MKIFYQTNDNDCGIAVTQTLINHFFKREIPKEELYQESNLKEEGLSILDLEILNEKYGIKLESYSMTFEEFKEYKTKDLFLLVINRNGEQHYTVAKKNGKNTQLFDPSLGKITVSEEEMQSLWLDIFIKVTPVSDQFIKTRPNLQPAAKPDTNKLLCLFLVNIIVLFLSILNNYLIRYSFNNVFGEHDFLNLIKVLFLSVLCYLLFYFGELVEDWLMFRHKIFYSTTLYENLLNSLNNKKNSFFQKIGKDQFLILKNHIDCISSYQAEYINKRHISIFTLLVVSAIFIWISPWFIFLILLSAILQAFFWKFTQKAYHKYLPPLTETQNKGTRITYHLEQFIKGELNMFKLFSLVNQAQRNWREEVSLQKEIVWKNALYSKLNSFLNHFLYLVTFCLIAYYIFTKNLTFGSLMTAHFLHLHLNKSFVSLISYYGFKTKYNYSRQIYSQMLNVDSFPDNEEQLKLPKIIAIKNLFYASGENIIFNNLNLNIHPHTLICGASGSGKTVLYKFIINKLTPSLPSIYFDEQEVSKLNPAALRNTCIYQISNGYINPEALDFSFLHEMCENIKSCILAICEMMNINILERSINPDTLSSGQKQLVNILQLLQYKNKILLLDEIASHISIEAKILIYKHLIPHIATSNFVVCSEHAPEIIDFFPHKLNICSQ